MNDFIKNFMQKSVSVLCALTLLFCFVFSGCSFKKNDDEPSTTAADVKPAAQSEVQTQAQATTSSSSVSYEQTTKSSSSQKNTEPDEKIEDFSFDDKFKDAEELQKYLDSQEDNRLIKWYVDPDGNITTKGDKGVLGFGYSMKENCFYATGNAWQRNFGYTELYDKVSELIVISYDTIRVYFTYDNKDWMIQLWKGQYGLVLEGGEVGVYNRPHNFNITTYYNCAQDSDRLPISLTLYDKGRQKFTRKAQTSWWMTGFVPGQLGLGVAVGSLLTQMLTETTTITFNDGIMRDAFINGLKDVKTIFNNVDYAAAVSNNILIMPGERLYSFKDGDGTSATVFSGTYKIDGNSVTLTWK